MANLEPRLGVKLYRRGRSGFSLTDGGYYCIDPVMKIEANLP
jgi:DNA-binding transcriptional LysR family regulator